MTLSFSRCLGHFSPIVATRREVVPILLPKHLLGFAYDGLWSARPLLRSRACECLVDYRKRTVWTPGTTQFSISPGELSGPSAFFLCWRDSLHPGFRRWIIPGGEWGAVNENRLIEISKYLTHHLSCFIEPPCPLLVSDPISQSLPAKNIYWIEKHFQRGKQKKRKQRGESNITQ